MSRMVLMFVSALVFVACVPGTQERPEEQEDVVDFAERDGVVELTEREKTGEEGLRPAMEELQDALERRGGLLGLSTEQLIDESAGNCPNNEFEIPGQGAHAKGGIGGLAVAPYPTASTPGDATSAAYYIREQAQPDFVVTSAILVVDDFNGDFSDGVYFPDRDGLENLRMLPEQGPDERARDQEEMMDELEARGQLSHGALVFNHTLALLSVFDQNVGIRTLRVDTPASGVPSAFEPLDVMLAEFPYLGITVAAVDTEDFDTAVIAGRIAATLRALTADQGVTRFAINLSFGLVPCSVREDFRAAKEEFPTLTFELYVEEVLKANRIQGFREQLVSLLTTPIENDPLLALAEDEENLDVELPREREGPIMITYLASAGNYGHDWSLAPGYWSEFVSVSASNLSGIFDKADDYSNRGEVLLPGGFFKLTFYDPANRTWVTYPDISVAGTSFAAPVLSVYTALDFTNGTPRCTPTPLSPLAYFNTDPPVSKPLPKLNELLSTTVSRCP